jgi:glycosyltransferase involved in cell wall biosynthesis
MSSLVSIIVPCYRQAQFLAQAVESCLAQTHRPIEIIIVNDGSDDQTEQVARSFGNSVRYIIRDNGGISAARNTGIVHASGSYIKFLDADDHLAPRQIERQVSAISGHADWIAVSTIRTYHDGNPTRFTDIVPHYDAFLPGYLSSPDSAIHAYLFPAGLVRSVNGFDDSVHIAEDWEFFIRLGRFRPRLVRDMEVGGYYRLRADSMSGQRRAMVAGAARNLLRVHYEFRKPECHLWFGKELLSGEQQAYRSLLMTLPSDFQLQIELLACIKELQRHTGHLSLGWKFDTARRLMGYSRAEILYAWFARFKNRLHRNSMPTNAVALTA